MNQPDIHLNRKQKTPQMISIRVTIKTTKLCKSMQNAFMIFVYTYMKRTKSTISPKKELFLFSAAGRTIRKFSLFFFLILFWKSAFVQLACTNMCSAIESAIHINPTKKYMFLCWPEMEEKNAQQTFRMHAKKWTIFFLGASVCI